MDGTPFAVDGSRHACAGNSPPLPARQPSTIPDFNEPRPQNQFRAVAAVGGRRLAESERKPEVRLPCTWSHGMRSTESGEKVIQSVFIRKVEDRELQSHVVWLGVKKVIRPYAGVEQMARRDARRVRVVVFCSRLRNAHAHRRELRVGKTARGYGACQRGQGAAAVQADDGLLVGIQG